MKNVKKLFLCFSLAVFASIPRVEADNTWRVAAHVLLGGVEISSPAAEQFGVKIPDDNITITNGTPFWIVVTAYDENVALLGPGDSAYHDEGWEWLALEVPIVARFYGECEATGAIETSAPRCNGYLGVAGRVFRIAGGGGRTESWLILLEHIQRPTGEQIYDRGYGTPVYPPAEISPVAHKMKIRRRIWNAQTFLQMPNNSLYRIEIRANGRRIGVANPRGGLFTRTFYAANGRGEEIALQIIFTDREGKLLLGANEFRIGVPGRGIHAEQIFLSSYHGRR